MDENTPAVGARIATRERASGMSGQLLIVLGALILVALLYWPTTLEIADFWADTARRRYTHGWAVLAVTIWLVWRDRAHLRSMPWRPPVLGWVLVAIVSLAWLVAFNAALLVPAMLVLPVLVLTAIWAAGGWALARRVAFPVLFLYFALPVWDAIDRPLQSLTTTLSLWLVQLVGIPATAEGDVIHIPEGWFEIASSCNGLHFFIVALAIAAAHGHMDRYGLISRLALLMLAAVLAVLANLVRIFVVVVAGHTTNMQHFLIRVDHYYFGWVLFACALVLYAYLSSGVPAASVRPAERGSNRRAVDSRRGAVMIACTGAGLALGPLWAIAAAGDTPRPALLPPHAVAGWSGPNPSTGDWQPVFAGADEQFLVTYRRDAAREVTVFRAAYHHQRQGKELRGYGNSIAGRGYSVTASANKTASAGGRSVPVTEAQLVDDLGKVTLVWYTYASSGRPDPMGLRSRIRYGVHSLYRPPTASVNAIASECRSGCEGARAVLAEASDWILPGLLPALRSKGG